MFSKNTPKREDLKEGQILIYAERRGDYHTVDIWCKVVKISPKGWVTLTWKYNDKEVEKVVRPDYRELRVPTKYEVLMRAWKGKAPRCEVLTVTRAWNRDNDYRVELTLRTEAPPDDLTFEEALTKARDELVLFEAWYATKPRTPTEDDDEG